MRTILLLGTLVTLAADSAEAQQRLNASFNAPLVAPASDIALELDKRFVSLLPVDCDTDRARGREAAASQHGGGGWMAGGFVSGVLLGLIGTAITYAIASSSTVEVDGIPEGVEQACYRDGYSARARGINTSNALSGGLLGTALLVVLVVSATSGSGY